MLDLLCSYLYLFMLTQNSAYRPKCEQAKLQKSTIANNKVKEKMDRNTQHSG